MIREARQPIEVKRGDFLRLLAETDFNLGGYTIAAKARSVLTDWTKTMGVVNIDTSNNTYELTLDTSDAPLGELVWDITYTSGTNKSSTTTGRILIVHGITRSTC